MAKWKITINARGRGTIEVDGRRVPDVFGISIVGTAGQMPMLALTVKATDVEVNGAGNVVREPQMTEGGQVRAVYQCAECGGLEPGVRTSSLVKP